MTFKSSVVKQLRDIPVFVLDLDTKGLDLLGQWVIVGWPTRVFSRKIPRLHYLLEWSEVYTLLLEYVLEFKCPVSPMSEKFIYC